MAHHLEVPTIRPAERGAARAPAQREAVTFLRRRGRGATPASRPARLAALAALAALCACTSEVVGDGVSASREITVAPFHGVSVDDGITANVAFGAAQQVILSGDENVIHDFISVAVDSAGILAAHKTGADRVTSGTPLVLDVTLPGGATFDRVSAAGHGAVNVYGARTAGLAVSATDAKVTLAGGGSSTALTATVTTTDPTALSKATLTAIQHAVDSADVTATDANVFLTLAASTGSVTGTASGASTIDVCGSTTCDVQVSGGATCVPLDPTAPVCQN